ncbi:DUF1295 domain-containing protein [Loktanella sp. IMCC34160]|nr:DUF1295 domain-containing protein [Loktanella sp. IMCC34160]
MPVNIGVVTADLQNWVQRQVIVAVIAVPWGIRLQSHLMSKILISGETRVQSATYVKVLILEDRIIIQKRTQPN